MKVVIEAVEVEEADLIVQERTEWVDQVYTALLYNLGRWLLGLDNPLQKEGPEMKTVDEVLEMLPDVREPISDWQRRVLRNMLAQVPQEALEKFTPNTVICVHKAVLDYVELDIPWVQAHDLADTDKVFILFDGTDKPPTFH